MKIQAQFPEKLKFLFTPMRYKVARGGRGSAKSWSFAQALLIIGASKRVRVLCAREVQNSIKDSVHKLLKDQIERLNLHSHYRVMEAEIRGKNGTEFAFTGLSALTVDSIKSFEAIDYCWVEEGQSVSKRSWDILIPTIRKDNSEIWISYNPALESDETHKRFTMNPPEDCINALVNWRDNPWFNEVLEKERLHCKIHDPDNYDNIWEGQCLPAVEGAIYFKQVQAMEAEKRICNVPYDPLLKVHVVFDLGWEDSLSIGMVQRHTSEIRLIDYIEDRHRTLAEYSDMLRERQYNWGKVFLPWDGYSKDIKTGMGSDEVLSRLGWDVPEKESIVQMSVEEGIRATRQTFSRLYIDKNKCGALVESLKRYRRHLNRQTEAFGKPVHDDFSHGADMLRYLCINKHSMTNAMNTGRYTPPRRRKTRRVA